MGRSHRASLPELFMQVLDPKKIQKLMVIQGVSQRQLAIAAGWKSRWHLQKLLSGDATGLKPEPAARIARRLGVGIDDLFVTRLSTDTSQTGKRRSAA